MSLQQIDVVAYAYAACALCGELFEAVACDVVDIDSVVCAYPHFVAVAKQTVYEIAAQSVSAVSAVDLEGVSVEAVQTVFGAEPHKSHAVLTDCRHRVV